MNGDINYAALPVTAMDAMSFGAQTVRRRKKAEGLRLYIDRENPLFMTRRGYAAALDAAEATVSTWEALPSDVREFSAIYIDDHSGHDLGREEMVDFYDRLLSVADEHGIPLLLQMENWNSADVRFRYTKEDLDRLMSHPSFAAAVVVELSCNDVRDDCLARLKDIIAACVRHGALFIWQEMEYYSRSCFVARYLEDGELALLMREHSRNIVLMDKHNGQGRHFSNQANIMGLWLAGFCDNWGGNIENWLWYEEGLRDYDERGGSPRDFDCTWNLRYPPAMVAIDSMADIVAGATVIAPEGSEQENLYGDGGGKVVLNAAYTHALLPVYRRMLAGGIPTREEVCSKIKAVYRVNDPYDSIHNGYEDPILLDLYTVDTLPAENGRRCVPTEDDRCMKKWVPTTGRYYVLPILPRYASERLIGGAVVITPENMSELVGLEPEKKRAFFNSLYQKEYSGDGVMFDVAGMKYIFNSNESRIHCPPQSVETVIGGKAAGFVMESHTCAMAVPRENGFDIDLINLRLDTDDVCYGRESTSDFAAAYTAGGRMEGSYRLTEIAVEGRASVAAVGTGRAEVRTAFDGEYTRITVSSNGYVRISVGF